jgi:hypothetical protein
MAYREHTQQMVKRYVLLKQNGSVLISSEPSFTQPGIVVSNYHGMTLEQYSEFLQQNGYQFLFPLENGEQIWSIEESMYSN